MTTIEELLHTIEELISLVNEGLDHAVGRHGESDLTEKMRERLYGRPAVPQREIAPGLEETYLPSTLGSEKI